MAKSSPCQRKYVEHEVEHVLVPGQQTLSEAPFQVTIEFQP